MHCTRIEETHGTESNKKCSFSENIQQNNNTNKSCKQDDMAAAAKENALFVGQKPERNVEIRIPLFQNKRLIWLHFQRGRFEEKKEQRTHSSPVAHEMV